MSLWIFVLDQLARISDQNTARSLNGIGVEGAKAVGEAAAALPRLETLALG